ncbi:MAG: tail fiber domain-containing protein [Bacteroidia bacterium]
MKKNFLYLLFFFIGLFGSVRVVEAQGVPQGFNYQAAVRDNSGNLLISQPLSFRFSFYSGSSSGPLQWQETQSVTSDSRGNIHLVIGTGTSTGAGLYTAFSNVDWSSGTYYLKVSIDVTGGSSYTDMGTAQLFSVPYAFYSGTTYGSPGIGLIDFNDVDLSGISSGKLLKWNGNHWVPSIDNHSDTVSYAYFSGHSITTDTAYNVLSSAPIDTVLFAYETANTVAAGSAQNAVSAVSSTWSDTATYAFATNTWKRNGNALGSTAGFAGSVDPQAVEFRTNGIRSLKIDVNGNVLTRNTVNIADLSISGNDGFVDAGTFGSGMSSNVGAGTRLAWLPSKAAFRIGAVATPAWGDSIDIYSFSSGYDNRVGKYSMTSGYKCLAGDYTVAIGRKSEASARGAYPNGTGIALGDSCTANAQRTISMGRGNLSTLTTAVSIGTFNKATGNVSLALGSYSNSNGYYSTVIGYHGSANVKQSGFLYADASSAAVTNATANYQFMVRAAGGTIFYTDSLCTMGVTLFPGSGSWASVSDRNKKENFKETDPEEILSKITGLKIRNWSYRSQSRNIRHIGPMAQDFYRLFGVGENNITITGIDMDGVVIAGIQALNLRLNHLEPLRHLDTLEAKTAAIEKDEKNMKERLDAIEAALDNKKNIEK